MALIRAGKVGCFRLTAIAGCSSFFSTNTPCVLVGGLVWSPIQKKKGDAPLERGHIASYVGVSRETEARLSELGVEPAAHTTLPNKELEKLARLVRKHAEICDSRLIWGDAAALESGLRDFAVSITSSSSSPSLFIHKAMIVNGHASQTRLLSEALSPDVKVLADPDALSKFVVTSAADILAQESHLISDQKKTTKKTTCLPKAKGKEKAVAAERVVPSRRMGVMGLRRASNVTMPPAQSARRKKKVVVEKPIFHVNHTTGISSSWDIIVE